MIGRFRERRHDVQNKPRACPFDVYRVAEGTEINAALAKVQDGLNEMRERAPQPVELPNNERVARAQGFESGIQTGAIDQTSADAAIKKYFLAASRLQRVSLQRAVLVGRGARITGEHRGLSDSLSGPARGCLRRQTARARGGAYCGS